MSYSIGQAEPIRNGDIISTSNPKFGALTMSQNLYNYDGGGFSPAAMWGSQPAIRTVVDFMVDAMSLVPFDLYRRTEGGREKDRNHEIHRALKRPGRKLGQRRWTQLLQRDMLLYGRWAFFVLRDNTGELRYVRLPAHTISFVLDQWSQPSHIVIHTRDKNGQPHKKIRPLDDDIVCDINMTGDETGGGAAVGTTPVSVLEGLARETEGLNVYRSQLFKNSAMVPAVIERPAGAKWSDEAWRRFKETFATYSAGGGNAGGTPILEDGMTLKPVEVFNPRDAEYIEVRKLALVEAAQALHVPPELVGATAGTNSNIVALREQLYVDVLGAHLGYFEDALDVSLAPLAGDDYYIEANLEARLRATFTDRMDAYQRAAGGPFMLRSEVRDLENLPYVEGSDELIVPMNVTQGGLASPADTGQTNEEGGEDPLKAAGPLVVDPTARVADTKAAFPARKHAEKALAELAEAYAEEDQKIKAAFFRELKVETIAELQASPEGTKASPSVPAIDQAFVDFQVNMLTKALGVKLRKVAAAGSQDVLTELGISDWSIWSAQKQAAWVEKASKGWAEYVIHDRFVGTVNEAIAKDPGVWAMKVRDTMGTPEAARALSATMGKQVESFGRHDGAHAGGARTKTWRSTSYEPRDSHKALSGTTIDVDDVFSNGCRYPGDAQGPNPETQNCLCILSYSKEAKS